MYDTYARLSLKLAKLFWGLGEYLNLIKTNIDLCFEVTVFICRRSISVSTLLVLRFTSLPQHFKIFIVMKSLKELLESLCVFVTFLVAIHSRKEVVKLIKRKCPQISLESHSDVKDVKPCFTSEDRMEGHMRRNCYCTKSAKTCWFTRKRWEIILQKSVKTL